MLLTKLQRERVLSHSFIPAMAQKKQSGSTGCYRFLLVLFDYAVFASGILLVGYGSLLLYEESIQGLRETVAALPVCMIVIGSFVLILAITGCIGACKGGRTVNLVFSIALLIIIIAEIITGGLLIRHSKETVQQVESDLLRIIGEYENGVRGDEQIGALKQFQTNLHCCGANGPDDYKMPHKVCCDVGSICVTYPSEGCVSAYQKALVDYRESVGAAIVALAIFEIGAALCSMMIGRGTSFKNK
ncbi:unnamed protein product, partial [Hymenolepis diminuta]